MKTECLRRCIRIVGRNTLLVSQGNDVFIVFFSIHKVSTTYVYLLLIYVVFPQVKTKLIFEVNHAYKPIQGTSSVYSYNINVKIKFFPSSSEIRATGFLKRKKLSEFIAESF